MNCLDCGAPMIEHKISGVAVDYCDGCQALWFDSGEMEVVFREKYGDRFEDVPTDVHFKLFGPSSNKTCPRCSSLTLRSGALKTVPFNSCGTCNGLFITLRNFRMLAVGPPPSTELFDVGRFNPVDVILETLLFGPTGAMLIHMQRRIAETIGDEIR